MQLYCQIFRANAIRWACFVVKNQESSIGIVFWWHSPSVASWLWRVSKISGGAQIGFSHTTIGTSWGSLQNVGGRFRIISDHWYATQLAFNTSKLSCQTQLRILTRTFNSLWFQCWCWWRFWRGTNRRISYHIWGFGKGKDLSGFLEAEFETWDAMSESVTEHRFL